ncbi:MAG: hypothetical protein KJ622_17635 [Alphaproteobacteria bacterium]|nr:hypothetical protein [Alphaproteobacteria bacterium]
MIAATSAAHADMGTAAVDRGLYGGIEGGYLHQSTEAVNGFGIVSSSGRISEALIDPENGWFAGGMIGFARPNTNVMGMPISRIEGYILFGRTEDSVGATTQPGGDLTIKSVNGSVNVVGGDRASASVERRTIEGGLRFERDEYRYEGGSLKDEPVRSNRNLTRVISPFIRYMEEDTDTEARGCCSAYRNASVDNWMYGVMAAIEPEYWHTERIALVGRAGVGVYGYSVDGSFRSSSQSPFRPDPFAASVSDDESGVGFRGSLGAGLKFKISDRALLETFAEADYFSAVGRAAFSNASPTNGARSGVEIDDMWELRAGARLTIGFGGGN